MAGQTHDPTREPYPGATTDRITAINAFWDAVRARQRELDFEAGEGIDDRLILGINTGVGDVVLAIREATLAALDLPARDAQVRADALREAAAQLPPYVWTGRPVALAARLHEMAAAEQVPSGASPADEQRDRLVEAIGALISLPPQRVAEIYSVQYQGSGEKGERGA